MVNSASIINIYDSVIDMTVLYGLCVGLVHHVVHHYEKYLVKKTVIPLSVSCLSTTLNLPSFGVNGRRLSLSQLTPGIVLGIIFCVVILLNSIVIIMIVDTKC